jgi:peptidoglycan hydrolase CwlO-like protein
MDMDVRSPTRRFLLTAVAAAALAAAAVAGLALPGTSRSAVPAGRDGASAFLGRAPDSLAKLQSEARRTRAQMEQLNAEMQVVTQKWEAARLRLDEVNAQLVAARRTLIRSRNELDRQRTLVAGRMATMYKTGEFTWLDIAASATSLSDAEKVLDFLRMIAQQDRHEETELQRLAAVARRDEAAVEDDRQQAVQAQADLQDQRYAVDQKIAERAALLKDVVARIKKILSAPELLMKAGGKVTQITWAQAFLKRLGMPMTADNVAAVVAWEMAEGGHWYNTAYYNPLNTTQTMPGATIFNSVGVKAYKSWAQGLEASVITINNGFYGGILAAMRRGNDAQAVADAVAASPWGTGSFTPKN